MKTHHEKKSLDLGMTNNVIPLPFPVEKCVVCGAKTGVIKSTPVSQRCYYVEGAGQVCAECYALIYDL